jgi:hypothetical protein
MKAAAQKLEVARKLPDRDGVPVQEFAGMRIRHYSVIAKNEYSLLRLAPD